MLPIVFALFACWLCLVPAAGCFHCVCFVFLLSSSVDIHCLLSDMYALPRCLSTSEFSYFVPVCDQKGKRGINVAGNRNKLFKKYLVLPFVILPLSLLLVLQFCLPPSTLFAWTSCYYPFNSVCDLLNLKGSHLQNCLFSRLTTRLQIHVKWRTAGFC